MRDRIDEIEEQAKVILEWCKQQRLPEEQRDILELRERWLNGNQEWIKTTMNPVNLNLYDFRLRKRPKTHKATVYWYRYPDGSVAYGVLPSALSKAEVIGTSTTEFTEPQR